jgi:DNA-directed RNA polymerase subunit RPC12/RpoP
LLARRPWQRFSEENFVPNESSETDVFYARSPYAEGFDIGYPQENLEGEMYKYRCTHCKRLTTDINGKLENHADDCEYRLARMRERNGTD